MSGWKNADRLTPQERREPNPLAGWTGIGGVAQKGVIDTVKPFAKCMYGPRAGRKT